MEIRDLNPDEIESARLLLCANGWAHRIPSPEWFSRLIAASQRTAVAVDAGQVVGFARGITDGLSNGYLSMIVVAPNHRGKGIGAALVKHIVGDATVVTWVVRTGREGAREFFSRCGFTQSSDAMERVRS
jgi:ribosomal protein S18 acetylase RimI-like enzyme